MKQIGAEIGVNESRVSQLHARAIRRLRDSLGDMNPPKMAEMRRQLIEFAAKKMTMALAKAEMARPTVTAHANGTIASPQAVVLTYKPAVRRAVQAKAALKMPRQRQAVAAAR